MPIPTHYGSLHIPEGYIPPSVNPPVVPRDVITPTTDSEYWRGAGHQQHPRRPSQSHYRRPSQSHPPVQPVNPGVIPSHPFTEATTSTMTSSFRSPPFKPFQPLPEVIRAKPPPPPPKLLDTFSHLSHPSPESKNKALEIIKNRDKRDISRTHEEWRRKDAEREKAIRETKEARQRLISGASTINAPTMQTVTALVVDPTTAQQPPPPPKKEKKSFWRKLLHPRKYGHRRQQPAAEQATVANGPVIIPIGPQQVLPSIPGVVVPVEIHNQSYPTSSSSTDQDSRHAMQPMQTPAVIPVSPGRRRTHSVIHGAVGTPMAMPSPFLQPTARSTTPNISPPPTAAFFSIPPTINV
jgi:hypothetical protein